MRISLIGAGRVATHLGRVLLKRGHEIVQVYNRNVNHAEALASQISADAVSDITHLITDIDLAIIAVSDQAISQVIEQLSNVLTDVLIVHTSGSTHLKVLTQHHARSGVFYPLQTFSFEREIAWSETPLFVEASSEQDSQLLNILAGQISQRVYLYSSEQRLSLHLAAVFACNFSNYCYDMAKQVVDAKQVDFSLLYPLILETAKKATAHDPRQVQTGPAMRGDQNILNMHQQMLVDSDREDLQQCYQMMSEQISKRQPS